LNNKDYLCCAMIPVTSDDYIVLVKPTKKREERFGCGFSSPGCTPHKSLLSARLYISLVAVGLIFIFGIGSLWGGLAQAVSFEEVSPEVFLFRDTCNVYVIRYGDRAVAIDCGSAKVLSQLRRIGVKQIDWVLFTHHHRDQCQGVMEMLGHGAKIAIPAGEKRFFEDVEDFWRTERIYKRTVFKPDFFVLRQSVGHIDKILEEGDVLQVGDVRIKAVSTPPHTQGHMSYVAEVGDKRIAFTGDLIHSAGKLWNFHSLQYGYDDCGRRGAKETLESQAKVVENKPDVALPSHGIPIRNLAGAAEELKQNMMAVVDYFTRKAYPNEKRAEPPEWLLIYEDQCTNGWFQSYAIVDPEGNALVVDPVHDGVAQMIISDPRIKRVERIWISHYHFDHIEGTNRLKEHYGAKVYVHKKLADVLENPLAYSLPCLIEESIKVDHTLKHGESFHWRGIDFTVWDFPTQTWWHDGLSAVIKGSKYFFTGDGLYTPGYGQNDNCRNYCPIAEHDGLLFSARLLKNVKPDFLVTGHWDMWKVSTEDFDHLIDYAKAIVPLAEKLIAQEDINMGMDEQWASFYPYRSIAREDSQITVAVQVRNHLDRPAEAQVELRYPSGWQVRPPIQNTTIEKKMPKMLKFKIRIPRQISPARYIITANVVFAGKDYGELGEAIIDIE